MQYRPLGNSGLLVSEIVLGTVPFGGSGGFEKAASVDVEGARRQIDIALDAGVNLIDTANLYSMGEAEEITGKALGSKRQDIILASKARSPLGDNPNHSGFSRYHLIEACEASLRRLGTDHIDLYQMHNWDGITPIEEMLHALDHLIQSGKIRYYGTSNFTGWQMMKTIGRAELHNLAQPISQQIYYTPESREAEYELMPLAIDQNIATLVWGPMGEGLFNGKVRRGQQAPEGTRQGNNWPEPYVHDMARAYDIIELFAEIAEAHNSSIPRTCLAWLKDRPGVTSLIIGARSEAHLQDDLAAAELTLSQQEIDRIESATRPAPLYPYWHRIVAGMDRIDKAEKPFLDNFRSTIANRNDER
ncbi:aryl-alcohol dehydrogenase-like predicted oxidoreductase [Kushneria sinocarnis]|uniref:Aryl-alcohol dehydrogenase-like predicted oxidoreductase n=1 Tax=Kushneria sinocarnis TaxID=595502 RepID=A0A420WV07_9GAMM|nr:aldo/keto reductase [Kushneria sinocarnis]RKR02390.1 aryl-alcohol dehydrogenase-like predicted oxidoreductase [Kushneria sinocarnis]